MTLDVEKNDMTVKLINDDKPIVIRGRLSDAYKSCRGNVLSSGQELRVNLSHVAAVDAAARKTALRMKDGREIIMSRKQSLIFGRQFIL